MGKPYGSGYFGQWITDEQGLPAYRYDCDQLGDPAAISPTNPTWRKENDHTFQFGNDRITCVASNFGTVQARQDEGGPKFLGDIDPEADCYGGGLGWLRDGGTTISTYYDGKADSFERVYGTGYIRKTVKKGDLTVSQTLFAPYGDDPVIISRATITNGTGDEKTVKWHEYWGARMYPFSLRTLLLSMATGGGEIDTYINNSAKAMRRKFAKRYVGRFEAGSDALLNRTQFKGWGFADKQIWKIAQKKYRPLVEKTNNYSLYLGDLNEFEDTRPPATFLYAAEAPGSSFVTDAGAFFGAGGPSDPDGAKSPAKPKHKESHTAMIAVTPASIPPGGSVTLTYVYGYLPEGFDFTELKRKYGGGFDALFADSCEKWKKDRISLTVPGKEWMDRELLWHNQSLRSGASYDSAFGEHILSQGHVYQYIMGFQGASRDPLQHVMPFIFTDPGLVREIIRYTAKSMLPDGTVPYGICGNGAIMPSPFLSGDLELWLLWTASEYVLATKDLSILKEEVVPYPYKGAKQRSETVQNLLERGYRHFLSFTGTGANGLPGILGGDWNDNVVVGNTDPAEAERIRKEGESVLVGAFAAVVLERYTEALSLAGGEDGKHGAPEGEIREKAAGLKEAVAKQWNGKWFNRAYLGSVLGWIGDDRLWLEPQPWALMCGAADAAQTKTLLGQIKEKCQDPSPIGAMLLDSCPENSMKAPSGMATNGGVWPSITGTLILALGKHDPAEAYEEWRKNTLANHAEAYPMSWEGIWSGPDTYNSVLSDDPGRTFSISDPEQRKKKLSWMDYPVYNLHPHAWTLYNAACLFMESFTPDGAVFNMGFPEEEYSFESPLASLRRTVGGYEGKYAPAITGTWTIRLTRFDPGWEFALTANGREARYERDGSGLVFKGEGGGGSPLQWAIAFLAP